MKELTDTMLMEDMRSRLEFFEKELLAELDKYRGYQLYKPLMYAVSGGKRIRPLLLLLSFECVGGKGDKPLPIAVAIELIHTQSLIHDDVIDHSKLRRKKPSFYMRYGNDTALLSSDFVLAMVLDIISKCEKNRIIAEELAKASLKMCEGELEEVKHQSNGIDRETYIRILENKTASLFEVSAKLGAILGEGDEEEVQALSEYGRLLGIAYQLIDDIVDGKIVAKNPELGASNDLDSGINWMRKTALNYIETAKRRLEVLKESEAKHYLLKMPNLLIKNLTAKQ